MKWKIVLLATLLISLVIGNITQRERDIRILQIIKDFREEKNQEYEIIKDLQDRLKKAGLDSSIG